MGSGRDSELSTVSVPLYPVNWSTTTTSVLVLMVVGEVVWSPMIGRPSVPTVLLVKDTALPPTTGGLSSADVPTGVVLENETVLSGLSSPGDVPTGVVLENETVLGGLSSPGDVPTGVVLENETVLGGLSSAGDVPTGVVLENDTALGGLDVPTGVVLVNEGDEVVIIFLAVLLC